MPWGSRGLGSPRASPFLKSQSCLSSRGFFTPYFSPTKDWGNQKRTHNFSFEVFRSFQTLTLLPSLVFLALGSSESQPAPPPKALPPAASARDGPVLVHCASGKGRSACVIVPARRLAQGCRADPPAGNGRGCTNTVGKKAQIFTQEKVNAMLNKKNEKPKMRCKKMGA